MKKLWIAILILIGLQVYSDEVNTFIAEKMDTFMSETVFGGVNFAETNTSVE